MHGSSPEPIDEPFFPRIRSLPLLPDLPAETRTRRSRSRSVTEPLQLLRCFRLHDWRLFHVRGPLVCNYPYRRRDAATNIHLHPLWPSVAGYAPRAAQRLLPAPTVPSGAARDPRVAPTEQTDHAVLLALQRVSSVARIQAQWDLARIVPLRWDRKRSRCAHAGKFAASVGLAKPPGWPTWPQRYGIARNCPHWMLPRRIRKSRDSKYASAVCRRQKYSAFGLRWYVEPT
jgi:hypothetical protein